MRPVTVTLSDASGGAKTSSPIPLDIYAKPEVGLQIDVTGTVNYTVQQTLDDVFDTSVTPDWFNHSDSNLVAATASKQGNYSFAPRATRIVLNSGTGSVDFTVVQYGMVA